jgi:WD40 repeat protein
LNPIDGTLSRTLNGHTHWVNALTFFKNGDIASGLANRTKKFLNPINGSLKRTLYGQTEYVLH